MTTFDLTSLGLGSGSYVITIAAKGTNWRDSPASAGVRYTVKLPYLTFSYSESFSISVADNTKHWDGTLEYSTDTSTWSAWDGTAAVNSSADGKLYMRGIGNTKITGTDATTTIGAWEVSPPLSDPMVISGNIENLLDYATVANGGHPTMADGCYKNMFLNWGSNLTAPALLADVLSAYCYDQMFSGLTAVINAIDLTHVSIVEAYSLSSITTNYAPIHLGTSLTSLSANAFAVTSNISSNSTLNVYYHFTDADAPQFDTANMVVQGTSKKKVTYNIYTDNTIIKDAALAKAAQYTTVNVYHLNGEVWE